MIHNVAELLDAILASALPELDVSPVSHGPSVGAMYEGISGKLLELALPPHLGLRVVSGFATDGNTLSKQIDRMIVSGSGEAIPHTEMHIWPVEDVIAAVEVKKTLTQHELSNAISQLKSVRDVFLSWSSSHRGASAHQRRFGPTLASTAFAQMTGHVTPSWKTVRELPEHERHLLEALLEEEVSPIRIVLGVHGHQSESGLRRAYISSLRGRAGEAGYSPTGLPQLVISGRFSVIKANGQPYTAPLVVSEWPAFLSTRANPLLMLLELVWTRLDVMFGLGDPWGDDLRLETPSLLMAATGSDRGWICREIPATEAALRRSTTHESWSPAVLSEEELVIVLQLLAGNEVHLTDPELITWLAARGLTPSEVAESLVRTRLVAMDKSELRLTTTNCRTATLPTGEYVAGEDSTGRLTRWIARHYGPLAEA